MTEQQERTIVPTDMFAPQKTETPSNGYAPPVSDVVSPVVSEVGVASTETVNVTECNGDGVECRHARAGREGARRVHQLIKEGRLYEQEHGLKRGRQRLRQLIELGKLYEQEHGLRPTLPKKRGQRMSRLEREELVATFLQCLLRMMKPSFRAELARLTEALQTKPNDHAA